MIIKSLKNRILIYFSLFAIVVAGIVFPMNFLHKRSELTIRQTVAMLDELYLGFIKDEKFTGEFITLDAISPNFFITGESPALVSHEQQKDGLLNLITEIKSRTSLTKVVNLSKVNDIEEDYIKYCQELDSMVYYVYKRGYKDSRLDGNRINNITKTKKEPLLIKKSSEIRKIEQDNLDRNNSALTFSPNSNLSIKTNSEFTAYFSVTGNSIENLISTTIIEAEQKEQIQITKIDTIFTILSILLFLSIVLISYLLSGHLVNHLEKLLGYISQLSKQNFNYNDPSLNLKNSSTEIREIYKEFRNMVAQLKIRETQRDKALADVIDRERMYREMADLLPQSIFETDRLGNLIYSNKAWHKAFGYSEEEISEGLNLIEILQTNTESNLFGINKVENSDYVAIRKDGTKFPALVYSDVISKDQKILGRRGIIIDATLRNKYIESLQKETVRAVTSDKLKSSFLANMSHEIRTPMNSIIGFANLLSAEQVPDEQKRDYIKHIQSSGQLLLNLIDDIIDIAKIEAGEIRIKPVRCEPVKMIYDLKHTFEGYKTRMGKQHIKIFTHLPETELPFKTDPFRLRQIITNLVSNAVKFTDEGTISIHLETKNERFLEFSVEDTGVGLTKEDLKVIFSRFKRTSYSEEKNISGTGLGLTISKNLVELLGGQMWVSSVPAHGTRFWFQLPYARLIEPGEKTSVETTEMSKNKKIDLTDHTILIAEDDDNSYKFLKEVLQRTNARIIHAVNGKEAVEAVKFSDDIDLILMDIQMPFLDGHSAAKEIKKYRPVLPIIAQTARAMEGDREKAILSGCDDYITKPINPQNLLAKIQQFITPKQTTRSNIPGTHKTESSATEINKDLQEK